MTAEWKTDEKYPGYVADGVEGYTLERALKVKEQKEEELKKNPKVVEVQVAVRPLEGMNAKPYNYCVHNTSVFSKSF